MYIVSIRDMLYSSAVCDTLWCVFILKFFIISVALLHLQEHQIYPSVNHLKFKFHLKAIQKDPESLHLLHHLGYFII